jgi:hypothetical protein
LNFVAGQTVPNLATVQLGQAGKFSLSNSVGNTAAGAVDVIIDLVGWYGSDSAGALFHELAPDRIVDTRFGTTDNPGVGKVLQNVPLTANVCGASVTSTAIPSDASAVVVNASVVAGSTYGWLTMWPTGSAPNASNLNYAANLQIANLAIVKVGPSCTIKVGNSPLAVDAHAGVHVILDLVGWFGPLNTPGDTGGKQFHSMAPSRIVDTRPTSPQPAANPTLVGALAPEGTADDVIACGGPTPASGTAAAVILNLVATGPTMPGWLTLYPGDASLPEASNLLFAAGQTVPNLAIVKVKASNCSVRVTNSKSPSAANPNAGTTHMVADLMGWFE